MCSMRNLTDLAGGIVALTMVSAEACWAQAALGARAAEQAPVASGTIAAIDPAKQKLVVKGEVLGSRQHFVIDRKAKITDGQQPVKLEELTPGTDVQVRYAEQDGRRIAQAITVVFEAKPAASPSKETPSTDSPSSTDVPAQDTPSPDSPSKETPVEEVPDAFKP